MYMYFGWRSTCITVVKGYLPQASDVNKSVGVATIIYP